MIINNIREAAKITGTTIPPLKPSGDNTEQIPQQRLEPQNQDQVKPHKQLGRKKKHLKDLILLSDKEGYYEILQSKMKGASPDVAMEILINAIINKALLKPSYGTFCDAFKDVIIPESTYYYKIRKAKV